MPSTARHAKGPPTTFGFGSSCCPPVSGRRSRSNGSTSDSAFQAVRRRRRAAMRVRRILLFPAFLKRDQAAALVAFFLARVPQALPEPGEVELQLVALRKECAVGGEAPFAKVRDTVRFLVAAEGRV